MFTFGDTRERPIVQIEQELHLHKCFLWCVTYRTLPVIRKVFEFCTFFGFVIDIPAYGASPHVLLLIGNSSFKNELLWVTGFL